MRFLISRSNLPVEDHSKYKHTCNNLSISFAFDFSKHCHISEILATAFRTGQNSGIQNAYFLNENCLSWASRIKFDARTPSESGVAPKSN